MPKSLPLTSPDFVLPPEQVEKIRAQARLAPPRSPAQQEAIRAALRSYRDTLALRALAEPQQPDSAA